MQRREIDHYLLAAAGHSIVVDARQDSELPGMVRTVTIHGGFPDDYGVTIEWDSSTAYLGEEEGRWGPKWIAAYENLDDLIRDLEVFLGPMSSWSNFTRIPLEPNVVGIDEVRRSAAKLEDFVRAGKLAVPPGPYRHASTYWAHIARFGEYRPEVERAELEAQWALDDAAEGVTGA